MTKSDLRLLVTCLAPDRKDFYPKVLTLFRTIKAFGGGIADADLVANFESHLDPQVAEHLRALGVRTRIVEPFDSSLKYSNKLRMLETKGDYDVLVALDCDVAVVRDFSGQISPNFFQAKPVTEDRLSIGDWKKVFSFFGLDLPAERYKTTGHNSKETIPYFNSGVISIPKIYVQNLQVAWARYIQDLSKSQSSFSPNVSKYFSHFLDQAALALALASEKLPVKPFSIEMNFPTHFPVDPALSPNDADPFILHYHRWTSDPIKLKDKLNAEFFFANLGRKGLLLKSGYKSPDMAIRRVNDLLRTLQKMNVENPVSVKLAY